MKDIGYILVFLFLCSTAHAQLVNVQKRVSIHYENKRLKEVLDDMSKQHQVQFSYSSYFIPVDQRVTAHVENQTLLVALDNVFATTQIVYAVIGGQIVLKVDPNKPMRTLTKMPGEEPVLTERTVQPKREKAPEFAPIQPRPNIMSLKSSTGENLYDDPIDQEIFDQLFPVGEMTVDAKDYNQLAQVSVWPSVGTNADYSEELTNTMSLNVFWGVNGGVNGVEVGGFVNGIRKDVQGLQIAGIGNVVGGKVIGSQTAGIFNKVGGETIGFQAAGIVNLNHDTKAIQVAGIGNQVEGKLEGIQIAGVFNITKEDSKATQAAGIVNWNTANAKVQLAGLLNVAQDVDGQLSGLVNQARQVDGYQIGLINIADTVGVASVGLLNFIRKGYNTVEISGGDLLKSNLGVKFGSPRFYNIIQIGTQWQDNNWGLGYGIGAVKRVDPRWMMNVEILAMHLNEGSWTNELNLLSQLRLFWSREMGKCWSIFLGPTLNWLASKRTNDDGLLIGSELAPYTIFEHNYNDTNMQYWAGFNVGVRF